MMQLFGKASFLFFHLLHTTQSFTTFQSSSSNVQNHHHHHILTPITTTFAPNVLLHSLSHPSLSNQKNDDEMVHTTKDRMKFIRQTIASLALIGMIIFGGNIFIQNSSIASASDSRLVGEISGSGILFKDTLDVESFDDPKVKGVTLYISNFKRPLTERLQKDFFSDPSFASVSCAKTGTVEIDKSIKTGKGGEEVFEESRSLLFKTLRVQRIYDQEKNTVVYVSFNTRLNKDNDSNKSRFKSSTCAVSLD